ncbi:MAG: molybdate ABC transporter substrate-binding protein [Chloroflexi bacterium]|nr:molybdate ABC transporter substrate-binding protein [Chloroflexota bacterium]
MRRMGIFGLWLAVILGLAGCNLAITPSAPSAGTGTTELTVFAAASLTDAFNEVGKNFEAANPGVKLTFNFAGSQQLAQQLGQGAPADVFASANGKQMDVAITAGRIVTGTARTFVRNRLLVIAPKDNPGQVKTLQDLAKPGLKLVFAAKEVPVGQYALDFLDKATKDGSLGADYKDTVLANVVSYEDNVRSVLAKITLGEGDAGIVYSTDAFSVTDKVERIDIPDNLNTLASYPIATITDSANADLAKKFVDYVFTTDAQTVLAKYGFIPTNGSATGAAPATLSTFAAWSITPQN